MLSILIGIANHIALERGHAKSVPKDMSPPKNQQDQSTQIERADEAHEERANVGSHHRVWRSETAFIVATAAAAVGLGNLWRFPYLLGEQGGAVFLIAYLVCLVFVAFPIAVIELSAGRRLRSGVIGAYSWAGKRARLVGYFVLALIFTITSYYLVLTGWTLSFALDSIDGTFVSFDEYKQGWASVFSFAAVLLLAIVPIVVGVGAIEKLAFVTAPVLFLSLMGLGFYAWLESSGWDQSVKFLTEFEFRDALNASLWYNALGQSFYSLMIGQGYLLTYGRHVSAETGIPRATGAIACVNATAGIVAGFVIFPFVFGAGQDPAQGPQLVFSVLPAAIKDIPLSHLLGIVLFGAFFLAAFSSCVASLKTIVDGAFGFRKLSYRATVFGTVVAVCLAGLPSALSYTSLEIEIGGQPFLDRIDDMTGSALVILAGIVGAVVLTKAGRDRQPK